jgi:hypothetical protein
MVRTVSFATVSRFSVSLGWLFELMIDVAF